MTIKKAWEGLLEGAVRAFLDRYGSEDWTEEEALAAISELDERMHAKFHDEWLDMRVEKVKESFADAGHPDEEELMGEAEARGEAQHAIPSERTQEVRDAVEAQLRGPVADAHRGSRA